MISLIRAGMVFAIGTIMPANIAKPLHEVALILTLRPARTAKGAAVQAAVLFRVEASMWIAEALKGG
jgi:hypothetical protein